MPRNITVTFEDGSTHVYQNAPDTITPQQVQERASKDFGKAIKALDGGRKPADKPSFGQMLKDELLTSLPGGIVRGVKDVIDTGAEYVSRLGGADEAARVKAENEAGKDDFARAQKAVGAGVSDIARIGGQVLGTAPIVSALGAGATAAGANRLGSAISSFGGTTSAAGNPLANLAIRSAGGGIAGGTSTAMVDPESAGTSALIGAATPGALLLAGKAGQGVGRLFRGPEQAPQMAQAVKAAQDLGLVIPPTQARASLGNRLLEGAAGKLTTAQNASLANSLKVKEVAARELGLPADTQLTPEVISSVKKAAGALYDAVSNAGTVTPGKAYMATLDDIVAPHLKALEGFPNAKPSPVITMIDSLRSESFDAASAVAKIKELRSAADDAFKPGGAGADIGRAAKKAAKALEDTLDDHLKAIGEPDLLNQFREARTLYAKASTVDKALDQASGTVDARKWAADLQKGKPLSGDIKKVAEAAAQFKTAFKTPEQMGSLPQFSPLDLYGGAGIAGVGGALTGNPLAALGLGLPLARAGARKVALSPMVQNRLIQSAQRGGPTVENALALGSRAYPLLAAGQ